MKISEIMAGGSYTPFARMGSENRQKHIQVVQYIMTLAASTDADISEWNIYEIFGTGRGNTLYLDRRNINQRFLTKLKEVESSSPQEVQGANLPDLAQLQAEVNDQLRRALLTNIENFKRQQQEMLRQAGQYYERFMQHVVGASSVEKNIMSLTKRNLDIAEQIRGIVEGNFWVFDRIESNRYLFFVTRNDIINSHINRNLGINIRVNLGKYEVKIDLQNPNIWVLPKSGNTRVRENIIHPHVADVICWGNAANTVGEKLSKFDFVSVMRLLANLLMDYNDENPYASLYSFQTQQCYSAADRIRSTGGSLQDAQNVFRNANLDDDVWQCYCERRQINRS